MICLKPLQNLLPCRAKCLPISLGPLLAITLRSSWKREAALSRFPPTPWTWPTSILWGTLGLSTRRPWLLPLPPTTKASQWPSRREMPISQARTVKPWQWRLDPVGLFIKSRLWLLSRGTARIFPRLLWGVLPSSSGPKSLCQIGRELRVCPRRPTNQDLLNKWHFLECPKFGGFFYYVVLQQLRPGPAAELENWPSFNSSPKRAAIECCRCFCRKHFLN